MFGVIGTANQNLSFGFVLIRAMYKYHRLEYYNHRWRTWAILVTTWLSAFCVFFLLAMGFYLTWCLAEVYERDTVAEAFRDDTNTGICARFILGYEYEIEGNSDKFKVGMTYFAVHFL